MSLDLSAIAPLVREILTRPETDLSTITARGVRKQLPELDESLTPSFLKENKEELEEIIAAEFERISPNGGSGSEEGQEEDDEEERTHKRKRDESDGEEEDEDENADDDDEGASPKKKPKKAAPKKASPKKSEVLSDAELARQLSHEINGRERRSTARGGKKVNGAAKPKRGGRTKKSAATVDSDSDAEGSPSKKPKPKRASTGGARGGFSKEHALSAPLAALLETDRLSRPQCVKKLWEYIKGNNLQNPDDKREILGDEKFKAVFGVDRLHMMKMNKLLGQHLHELPTA